jgi:outer membrane lipoprotein SlyB
MPKTLLYFYLSAILAMTGSAAWAASAVSISYGVVESVQTVQHKASHAGGAVAGGVLGAIVAGPRHRLLKVGASAAAGAAVQGAVTSGTSFQYRVRLIGGGESIVTTEQREIRQGDCVSIEQGSHANIRRVSNYHCEQSKPTPAPEHHASIADACQSAKNELVKAESESEVNTAVKKVRVLCED